MSGTPAYLGEDPGEPIEARSIQSELQRLLKSDQFKNSRRCGSLLTYIVEEALAGRGEQLKERVIGVSVFGRDPDYDTSADPVVRNAAIELRKRLAQVYFEPEENAPVRIELHAGTYRPEFRISPQIPRNGGSGETHAEVPSRRRLSTGAILALALPVCVGLGILVYYLRPGGTPRFQNRQAGSALPVGTADSSPSPGAVARSDAIRILAGSQRSDIYIDRFGNQWLSDRYFKGGAAEAGVTTFFFPPADPELFRTMRRGAFAYEIPLKPNQTYEMRLYFTDPYRYHNEAAGEGASVRLFQVLVNGQVLLNNFDIIADAGFASTTIRAFKNIVPTQDGKLHLEFIPVKSVALVNAIELLPMTAKTIPPIRIHAGASYYTDQSGNSWGPDNFYIGGDLYGREVPITGTLDPDIYKVERFGNFHYAIPVPPGRYSLTLSFAETFFHGPGLRVFDVSCNGVMLLHNFDMFREAGFAHVFQKTFHGLEPNGQGKLLISFSPSVDLASVRTLQVVDESR